MKPKLQSIVVTSPSFSRDQVLVDELAKLTNELKLNLDGLKFDEDKLISFIKSANAEGLILGTETLSANLLASCPSLKVIGKYGVGIDNIDFEALGKYPIHFGYEAGVNRRSVSELALGFMLGHSRNIFRSIALMSAGTWNKNGGLSLSGKTVGIIGLGHIGKDLVGLLAPFACQVLYTDIAEIKDAPVHVQKVNYPELLSRSDIISFHVPGSASTLNMFSWDSLRVVKDGCLLINTSRGNVVDFEAAVHGVRSGKLSGYASDVFKDEPLDGREYSITDGFYFTPHIGGNSAEAVRLMGMSAIQGIKDFLDLLDT